MWPGRWEGSSTKKEPWGNPPPPMTNRIALVLAAMVIALFAADLLIFHWGLHLFLGRKFVGLVEYLAIWR